MYDVHKLYFVVDVPVLRPVRRGLPLQHPVLHVQVQDGAGLEEVRPSVSQQEGRQHSDVSQVR